MIYKLILFSIIFGVIYGSVLYQKNILKFFKGKFFKENRNIIIVNLIVLIIIIASYTWGSSQIARYFKYNERIVGKPVYNNFYSPFLIFKLLTVKGIKNHKYISTVMTKTGIIMNLFAFFLFVITVVKEKKRGKNLTEQQDGQKKKNGKKKVTYAKPKIIKMELY